MKNKLWLTAAMAALLAGPAAIACSQAPRKVASAEARKAAPMHLVYQRSGGIAGFNDHVEVQGDSLTVTRRGKVTLQRTLNPSEQQELAALAERARQEPVQKATPHRPVPDAFSVSVSVDGQTVSANQPPEHLGPAWQKLADALSRLVLANQ